MHSSLRFESLEDVHVAAPSREFTYKGRRYYLVDPAPTEGDLFAVVEDYRDGRLRVRQAFSGAEGGAVLIVNYDEVDGLQFHQGEP